MCCRVQCDVVGGLVQKKHNPCINIMSLAENSENYSDWFENIN